MAYERELEVAIEAARAAAELCRQVQRSIPAAIEKKDKTPVTVADFGSQALICRALAAAFPEDPVVGEEDAAGLRDADAAAARAQVTAHVRELAVEATEEAVLDWIDRGNGEVGDRFWTLDPIDGTKGFLRGEQYAIALALIENGDLKVGVLACPNLPEDIEANAGSVGMLFAAVRGQGARCLPLDGGEARAIQVVSPDDTAKLRFVESVESGHSDHSRQDTLAKQVGISAPSLRIDSQCKYGAVASGQAALYLRLPSPKTPDYRENIWDHAAGALVVEEAGGKVTDMHGKSLNFAQGAKLQDTRGVIVSNGSIHDATIAALAAE